MLGKMDEYLIHQAVLPLQKVVSENPAWQDRFYFNFLSPETGEGGMLGLGAFPNLDGMQAICNFISGGRLYCKVFYRQLNCDRESTAIGGLRVDVLEPQKQWAIQLKNEGPVELDLVFTGRNQPYEFDRIQWSREGDVVWDQCHYTQAGKYEGYFDLNGKRLTHLLGFRDRSWGIRDNTRIDFWIWISANFKDSWLTAWMSESATGERIKVDGAIVKDGRADYRRIKDIHYEIDFDSGKRTPKASRFQIITDLDEQINVEAIPLSTIYISLEEAVFDLEDPQVLGMLDTRTFAFDQFERFDWNGDIGYGLVEFYVMGGNSKYHYIWKTLR